MDILRLKQMLARFWVRTLKVDILTVFTLLMIITFTCVIVYSYFRNYHAIMEYSQGAMERNSTTIVERINRLETEAREILEDTSGLLVNSNNVSVDNPSLQRFMFNVLKSHPNLSGFFLAFPSGNRILIKTLESSSQTHFMNTPEQPLPPNSVYIVKIMDVSKHPNPEIWYYKDAAFNTLASEEFSKLTLIVQTRPWYTGALKKNGLYWTEVYPYLHTHDMGLTVSYPVFTSNRQLAGILGADISLDDLSNFLRKQRIGKAGEAFILDQNGQLVVPQPQVIQGEKISPKLISQAFNESKKTHDQNFLMKFNGVKYLVFIGNMPAMFDKQWLIITIVPFVDFFGKLIHTQFEIIFITLGILCLSILIIIYFSKRISRPIVKLAKEVDKITTLKFSEGERVNSHIVEIKMLDSSVAAMRTTIHSFIRYVPKEIVRQLLLQGKEITLAVEKKNLTIFFSDIQDFTTIAETHSLSELMPQLNEYYDGLSKVILKHQGTIDKYVGDSVMAIWGAPLANPQHAIFACRAALHCQLFVNEFNQRCRERSQPEFITRFGLSSGVVVVGNIGTQERMNYTVIGDAANTASRLEATNKIYNLTIIISESVYNQLNDEFLVRVLDLAEVKGKKNKIKIYELMALQTDDPPLGATPEQRKLCESFTRAYAAYEREDFQLAKQLFTELHQEFPHDYPTLMYINRLAYILGQ